jgi:hypothetical protein
MIDKRDLAPRICRAGLLASIIAVAAQAVTVLADTHNDGFGQTVTREEQMFFFAIAGLLLVVQTIACLIHRVRHTATHPSQPQIDRHAE